MGESGCAELTILSQFKELKDASTPSKYTCYEEALWTAKAVDPGH